MRRMPRTRRRLPLAVAAATIAVTTGAGFASLQGTAIAGEGGPGATIRNAGGPTAMKDNFVVVLRDGPAALEARGVDATAEELTNEFGGKVEYRYTAAVRGFSVHMSEAQARRLATDPRVAYVEQNHIFRISDTQDNPPSQGLDRIDQRDLPLDHKYNFATTAGNVTAYIIDTGVRTTHKDFGGRASSGFDAVDNDNDATDCNGHGTHVAGTVGGAQFGVAKGVKIVAVRVLDCDGTGTDAGVIAGVDFVTKNAVKPAVANMSLGGGNDPALDAAVRASVASGVTYALAAGNDNADACGSSPGRVTEAITVGAIDNDDARAGFSNFGQCVDLFAPGVDITSDFLQSDTATATLSGTSMATPHVTGAAALFLATHPNATPQQVRDGLVGSATDGKVTDPGGGSPNKLLFTGDGGNGGNPAPTPSVPPGTPQPPAPPAGACGAFSQGDDVAIPDLGTVTSSVKVAGCPGRASATSRIDVHVKHAYRGDLAIGLIAPDGTVYPLKRADPRDGSDDVDGTATVDLSRENRNGSWKLRVRDSFRGDTGHIDSWTLTL